VGPAAVCCRVLEMPSGSGDSSGHPACCIFSGFWYCSLLAPDGGVLRVFYHVCGFVCSLSTFSLFTHIFWKSSGRHTHIHRCLSSLSLWPFYSNGKSLLPVVC
jgi:hypothetical protein